MGEDVKGTREEEEAEEEGWGGGGYSSWYHNIKSKFDLTPLSK